MGYSRFNERQQVLQAARNLVTDLRQAQQKALSGEKPSGWCSASGLSLAGWQVTFVSTTSYRLEGVCSDAAVSSPSKTITLSGAAISGAYPTSVLFASLSGTTSTASVTLIGTSAGSSSYSQTVSITSAGAMTVQ